MNLREVIDQLDDNRLLIVDDQPSVCTSLSQFALHYGFLPSVAFNCKDAFELQKINRYKIAIVDVFLPVSSGLELLLQMEEADIYPQVVILITGGNTLELDPRIKISAFFTKPPDLQDLAESIIYHLGED